MAVVDSIRGGRFKYNLKSFSMFRCRRRCSWKHKTYKSCLSTRVVFFLHRSLSTLLSSTAFLCSSTSLYQAPLCCFIQTHLFPSISNCFQYQPLGILLSGISLIVIRSHPHIVWITHSHTSSATTFGFIPHVLVSVCLDFPISDSYPQTCACVGFFLLPRRIR